MCAAVTITAKCHGIVCTAKDQCHVVGICDPNTALCSNPNKTDGTTCNDGNACTQIDSCQAGVCTGANPVACQPLDGCHDPGICDQNTGICSNPADPNGPACGTPDGWTPSTPLVLQATALSSGAVHLTWNEVGGETAYFVIRSNDGGTQFVQANQSPAGTTTWDDTARTPLTTYCYKVRAQSGAGYASSNMACVETALTFEAENQTSTASDGAIAVISDATASAGKYSKAPLAGVGSWVEYVLNVPLTGTFRVKARMATGPDRGTWRLQVDGKYVSLDTSGYAAQPGNTEVDLGEVKFDGTTAQKHFRFLVTGKDAQSTGYVVAMDAFALFNVGIRYEGENSSPAVGTDDSETNTPDTAASNGKIAATTLNAVDDFLQFTLSVPAPGKYQVVIRYKTGPDRGIFQANLDAADLGASIDAYAASPAYVVKVLGIVDIATAGPHTVTLKVTGKSGGSTGYGISVDYIELRPNPVVSKLSVGMEPVVLAATFGCGTQPDPQTQSGVVDSPTAVSFTIPGQIPIIMGNAGNQQATLVFRNGSSPAVTCTYKGGASASHPTTPVETIKGLKYQFQSCSDGSQAGATALATHFELSLIGVDCQSPATVTKARVHLGGAATPWLNSSRLTTRTRCGPSSRGPRPNRSPRQMLPATRPCGTR